MSNLSERARGTLPQERASGVAELVWRALRHPRGFLAELEIFDAGAAEVAALLPHLSDLRVERWSGESGTPYRDYVGELPCGLLLRVVTDAERVPDLVEGGGW